MKKRIIVILFSAFLGMTGKAAEADSLQRLAQSDIQTQLEWVNPTAIRAYLDDCREQLGERVYFIKSSPNWKKIYPESNKICPQG